MVKRSLFKENNQNRNNGGNGETDRIGNDFDDLHCFGIGRTVSARRKLTAAVRTLCKMIEHGFLAVRAKHGMPFDVRTVAFASPLFPFRPVLVNGISLLHALIIARLRIKGKYAYINHRKKER